eukprot:CCRYP_015857-RA/>CCRYP_015857-RA protein AED:0.41 eAED:0.41 QI:0/-1/0/1/-1/1/1/0/119
MDDLKVSHEDEREVTRIEKWLRRLYGNRSASRGKKHTYLGMQLELEYSKDGICKIDMREFTEEILKGFPEVIKGSAATPAADHLFKVRDEEDNMKKLPEEQASAFQRTVVRLLFLSGRV